MDDFDQIVKTISLTMGAAWGSGINLYATVLVLGIFGDTGFIYFFDDMVFTQVVGCH